MDHFTNKNGVLHAEAVNLSELAATVGDHGGGRIVRDSKSGTNQSSTNRVSTNESIMPV